MSSGLQDHGGKRVKKKSLDLSWRKVLELGEQLIALSQVVEPGGKESYDIYPDRGVILAQRSLIIHSATNLVDCEADLWLPRWLGVEIGYLQDQHPVKHGQNLPVVDIFTEKPNDELAAATLRLGQPCCLNVEDMTTLSPVDELANESVTKWASKNAYSKRCDGNVIAGAFPLVSPARSESNAQVLGVLIVRRPNDRPFARRELDLIEGLAIQAAIALQSSRQMAIERWRIEQLSLVAEVSRQLLSDLRDLDELAQRVTGLIQRTFDYDYVAIFTLEGTQKILRYRASAISSRIVTDDSINNRNALFEYIRLGEGIIGTVAQTGEEILANDVSQDDRFQYSASLPATSSEFSLPLRVETQVLGVLDVQSYLPGDFHEIDIIVLRALAGNIALALEGARLNSGLQRRAEQLRTIGEVGNAITSVLDQEELLSEVVNLIHERFGYPFVHLFSVHPGRRKIFFEAGSGSRSQVLAEQSFYFELDEPEGLIPWVARSGETILANDVQHEPRYRKSPIYPQDTKAELTLPLKFAQEVLGVLDIQSDQIDAFGQEEVILFEAMADSIAIALRNATLYRSERWRRQVADSLREVAGMLSADVGLDQVLSAILLELENNLPCELAAIWFLEEAFQDEKVQGKLPVLRLAAIRGSEGVWLEPQIGLNVEEILEPNNNLSDVNQVSSPPEWLSDALEKGQSVVRSGGGANDWFGLALEFPDDYSAVAAPLRVGDKNIGLLTLLHHTSGRYGSEARAMTEAFASYASVAIQNARLYESTQEQAWISTVLLQTADATQSVTDLNELLETVTHTIPMLVGVTECAIYLLGEDQVFIPGAAAGMTAEVQQEFAQRHFERGDVAALDRLLEENQATLVQRLPEDKRLAELFPVWTNKSEMLELLVLVPLLARGQLVGALLVHYVNDLLKNPLQALEDFFAERLPIVQGIAHQAALALDNIQLIKSQKEEAYISVALLQVAHAIVSSNSLQESLGSIVRITPILIGVKRAAVYLVNYKTNQLKMVESYGLPRNSDMFTYELGEFPIVKAAIERNELVVYPLQAVVVDEWEDVPEVWTYLPAPELAEIQNHLGLQERLLLVLPLSIKNEILGVFIIEEPDNPSLQDRPGIATNQRLRTKRLEIATGISQQLALAIQNDHLQQETVERERLAREMQLAREIQKTFLPDRLPVIPGWGLNLWWRTAREVGGDFYDLFELPQESLGIVIADVADKGMGAAMYMIMIRTLIRAFIGGGDSPAQVLERVNQLLLPDAHDGMFVTLFYGVLEPHSGVFQYANAGHNPPLWVRHDAREIELLTRSGMALGVLADTEIEDRSLVIGPGDFLILYTDGVTEAFDNEELTYGSERLEQAVWEAAFGDESNHPLSAESMLRAVDRSIDEFVRGAPVTDDSTMLVIFRHL